MGNFGLIYTCDVECAMQSYDQTAGGRRKDISVLGAYQDVSKSCDKNVMNGAMEISFLSAMSVLSSITLS